MVSVSWRVEKNLMVMGSFTASSVSFVPSDRVYSAFSVRSNWTPLITDSDKTLIDRNNITASPREVMPSTRLSLIGEVLGLSVMTIFQDPFFKSTTMALANKKTHMTDDR